MIWRRPSEESIDIYPGLTVWDSRVTGSITFGRSRLPLWAIIGELFSGGGWSAVEDGYHVADCNGWGARDFARFVYFLLEQRGEMGRLLCVLANAERLEEERRSAALEEQAPGESVVRIALDPDDEGVTLPPAWWAQEDIRGPVLDQLRRCVAALEVDR